MSSEPARGSDKPQKGQTPKRDVVRFNLYLPRDSYEALEELQTISGKRSLAETIRAALKLYQVVHEGIGAGKDIHLIDRKSKEKEKLISI